MDKMQGRSLEFKVERNKISTPLFFPSISSYGLKINLSTLVETIKTIEFDTVLISCYDVYYNNEDNKYDFINDRAKKLTFFDCGCYESYWFKDKNWDFNKYDEVLKTAIFDFYTSYDVYMNEHNNYEDFKEHTYKSIIKSEKSAPKSLLFPVLHNTRKNEVINLTQDIVADEIIKLKAVAYSERDLGFNIFDVISNIKKIREILNNSNEDIILHILGCGDPKTVALYLFCGVDSFDSRDWAKRTVNHYNNLTYPLNFLEAINCNCQICQTPNQSYVSKLLLHNLLYYQKFMNTLRDHIQQETFNEYISELIDQPIIDIVNKI
jgi:queuine/archaeosine tRNA-ribosyltransferase